MNEPNSIREGALLPPSPPAEKAGDRRAATREKIKRGFPLASGYCAIQAIPTRQGRSEIKAGWTEWVLWPPGCRL
jgi:hypothetical protein